MVCHTAYNVSQLITHISSDSYTSTQEKDYISCILSYKWIIHSTYNKIVSLLITTSGHKIIRTVWSKYILFYHKRTALRLYQLSLNIVVIYLSCYHYNDVIMSTMASQITSLMIVYPAVYSDTGQRKHQSSASLAFVRGIQQWTVRWIPRTKGQWRGKCFHLMTFCNI